ncbi:hypothetical protein SAMN05216371_4856 [Streptomyces sp. TLI_053]|uniref:hypothetical protein n=1 Tax=Streptomyces sp. TLI_053 TaxID=1855352 RepID=UPI00087A1958|nr:hypothetical protein [Streptomyces sp. TLI_053]SDT75039.1 hypothetical protein SAMN05216371_4856 [Streptomyces sp. TLI_053]
MTDSLLNVLLGLVASAISAVLGWLGQSLRRRRRLERTRDFLGLPAGSECLIVVNRSIGTGAHPRTVTRRDAYALMELAALVKECGAHTDLVAHDAAPRGLGTKTEFCFGGPVSNDRMAAHLAWGLPGVVISNDREVRDNTITIGGRSYAADLRAGEYVLLARLATPGHGRPVFLISGQTGIANHAGVRHLVAHHRRLVRRYGTDGTFALLLKVVNPGAYGPDVVEQIADVTALAVEHPPTPPGGPDTIAGTTPGTTPAVAPATASATASTTAPAPTPAPTPGPTPASTPAP